MPSATRDIIRSSGNYAQTLFLLAPGLTDGPAKDEIECVTHRRSSFPSSPFSSQSSIAMSLPGVADQVDRHVQFIQLPYSSEAVSSPNLMDGYHNIIKEAQKVAARWRSDRRSTGAAATCDAERLAASPNISSTSVNGTQSPQKSKGFSRSLSFNLLPSTQRCLVDEDTVSESLDAIIVYLPMTRSTDPEACIQASVRHACATTTAICPLLDDRRRKVGRTGSPRCDNPEAASSLHTSLIYVLPERYPANLPRILQSYLTSDLSIKAPASTYFQCFLLGNKTLNRKMQRQDDRRPITGLEIVMSGGMKWLGRVGSQPSSLNLYLDDFKQCRFVPVPRTEDFDSSSTNASYSSLTNTTTTDEEPLTPKLSREDDSIFDNEAVHDDDTRSTVSQGPSLSSRIRRQSKTSSVTSVKKTHFFRRLFTNDHVR